jgi:phenylacetate-CoA ligase
MAERPPHRREIENRQLENLQRLVVAAGATNAFYREKWGQIPGPLPPSTLADFTARFPLTLKSEIVADQAAHPPFGTNLGEPLDRFTRFHQTSGTTGHPVRWLDTPRNWEALVQNWIEIYRAAGVGAGDRVYFAFSFGPFIGFWLAFDAAQRLGALCVPGGGLSSVARLHAILWNQITVLCCTPTYALRLAEVAAREKIRIDGSHVRRVIVAGEPGGSVPATRSRIETAWRGAAVFDHHGMTEVGPVTYECPLEPGAIHIIESAYFAEFLEPGHLAPVPPGQPGELVLTTLTRIDSPLVRYRTGDLVKARPADRPCRCGRSELVLEGGILGRADDMIIVRGVNIFPSAVEALLGQFPEIAEFQARVARSESRAELEIFLEMSPEATATGAETVHRVESRLNAAFNLAIPVRLAPPGSLPRFEMKARRWVVSHHH